MTEVQLGIASGLTVGRRGRGGCVCLLTRWLEKKESFHPLETRPDKCALE